MLTQVPSIAKALIFAISGALALEAVVAACQRLARKFERPMPEHRFRPSFLDYARQPQTATVGSEILNAAVDYLTVSGPLLPRYISEANGDRYLNARSAWLRLWTAAKREEARRKLLTAQVGESSLGLMELSAIGQSEDIEPIERILASGEFAVPFRQLAEKTIEAIRARSATGVGG